MDVSIATLVALACIVVTLIAVVIYMVWRPTLGARHQLKHVGVRHYSILAILGLVVGVCDGMFGPGTGSFFVIGLVALLGYGLFEAFALGKLANLAINLAAIGVFAGSGSIWWKTGFPMSAANVRSEFIGARTAIRFGSIFVRKFFLVVMTVLGLHLTWDLAMIFVR